MWSPLKHSYRTASANTARKDPPTSGIDKFIDFLLKVEKINSLKSRRYSLLTNCSTLPAPQSRWSREISKYHIDVTMEKVPLSGNKLLFLFLNIDWHRLRVFLPRNLAHVIFREKKFLRRVTTNTWQWKLFDSDLWFFQRLAVHLEIVNVIVSSNSCKY